MRVNLITHRRAAAVPNTTAIPICLTVRPSCGLPGDYEYLTDSAALLHILRRGTDLPSPILRRFETELYNPAGTRLLGVELSDRVLTEIGYFID